MSLTNTDEVYGVVARFFHWSIALIIFSLIPVGLYMAEMAYGPDKLEVYLLHKSFGFLALFLVIGRIVWRVITLPPDHLTSHAPWERTLAGLTHIFLYGALLGMPLSGWIMSSAGEYPVLFFGLAMPDLIGKNEAIYSIAHEVHEILALCLIGAVALHVAGALKHHFVDKDTTLMRMTSMKGPLGTGIIVVLIVAFFAAAGYLLTRPEGDEDKDAGAPVAPYGASAQVNLEGLPAHGWAIVPGNSAIEFQGSMGGTPFTGLFRDFSGTIVFDPDNLQGSHVAIVIDTASATTNNAERDGKIATSEWFSSAQWPEARFESITIERTADNYLAVGNLTIRDVTLPVTLPFTVSFGKNDAGQKTALMEGRVQLNRLDYGVGQGEQWGNEQTVAGAVNVAVRVSAIQP